MIEYVNKKYKNGLACCPISDKVARYYKSIADFEDIGKRENTFLVNAKASAEVKNALRKFGPKLEAITDDDVARLMNYIKND